MANFADVVGTVIGGRADEKLKANFASNQTVIDLRGGDHIPGGPRASELKVPGEILLLDSNGALVVHDELDDLPAYEQATTAPTTPSLRTGGLHGAASHTTGGHGAGLEGLEGQRRPSH